MKPSEKQTDQRGGFASGVVLGRASRGGSSWHGFWKLPDRYEAWMKVADDTSRAADGYAMANKRMGKPMEDENVKQLNHLFMWAYARAKKLRPDWVKIYR